MRNRQLVMAQDTMDYFTSLLEQAGYTNPSVPTLDECLAQWGIKKISTKPASSEQALTGSQMIILIELFSLNKKTIISLDLYDKMIKLGYYRDNMTATLVMFASDLTFLFENKMIQYDTTSASIAINAVTKFSETQSASVEFKCIETKKDPRARGFVVLGSPWTFEQQQKDKQKDKEMRVKELQLDSEDGMLSRKQICYLISMCCHYVSKLESVSPNVPLVISDSCYSKYVLFFKSLVTNDISDAEKMDADMYLHLLGVEKNNETASECKVFSFVQAYLLVMYLRCSFDGNMDLNDLISSCMDDVRTYFPKEQPANFKIRLLEELGLLVAFKMVSIEGEGSELKISVEYSNEPRSDLLMLAEASQTRVVEQKKERPIVKISSSSLFSSSSSIPSEQKKDENNDKDEQQKKSPSVLGKRKRT